MPLLDSLADLVVSYRWQKSAESLSHSDMRVTYYISIKLDDHFTLNRVRKKGGTTPSGGGWYHLFAP